MTLEAVELHTGADPCWTVLWLHGLGADGHDFEPIVPELVAPDWPALRFVFPHAPVRPVTINGGMPMRAWYDIRDADLANRADGLGVAQSVLQVEQLIARERERGVPASRLLLAGFSQGGAVTLATALQRREPLAGLVALSTYLPEIDQARARLVEGAQRQPVFMAHGRHDPVVPMAAGLASAQALRGLGFDVQWHEYPMQHQVCAEQITDLRAWLGARLAG